MKPNWRSNQFLQAALIIGGIYLLWRIRAVLVVLFLAFLVATIMHPLVRWLKSHRWPTFLAILVPILLVIAFFAVLLFLLLPPFIHKLHDFAGQLPALLTSIGHKLHLSLDTRHLSNYINGHINNLSHYVFVITGKALKLLAGVVSIIVITVYWLNSYDNTRPAILELFPRAYRPRLEYIWERIELKFRLWIKAHLMLNTAVAVMVWVTMSLMHVPFADLLALIALVVEIIPTAGPFLAGAPAVLLGLSSSLLKGVAVALVYLLIQQIESHVLSPQLLGKTVQLHPILIITSLLIGAELFGIIGALLAVPACLCLSAVVDSYRDQLALKRRSNSG